MNFEITIDFNTLEVFDDSALYDDCYGAHVFGELIIDGKSYKCQVMAYPHEQESFFVNYVITDASKKCFFLSDDEMDAIVKHLEEKQPSVKKRMFEAIDEYRLKL